MGRRDLYVSSEDSEIFVVTAADGRAPVAKNYIKEVVMATPATSDGLIVVRTLGHLYGSGTEELTFPRRRPWATDSGAI